MQYKPNIILIQLLFWFYVHVEHQMFVIVVYGYHSGLALEQVGSVGKIPVRKLELIQSAHFI